MHPCPIRTCCITNEGRSHHDKGSQLAPLFFAHLFVGWFKSHSSSEASKKATREERGLRFTWPFFHLHSTQTIHVRFRRSRVYSDSRVRTKNASRDNSAIDKPRNFHPGSEHSPLARNSTGIFSPAQSTSTSHQAMAPLHCVSWAKRCR